MYIFFFLAYPTVVIMRETTKGDVMFDRFLDLVEANKQRDQQRKLARQERNKKLAIWALGAGVVAVGIARKGKTEIYIKD